LKTAKFYDFFAFLSESINATPNRIADTNKVVPVAMGVTNPIINKIVAINNKPIIRHIPPYQ
jgi:hypothetical protein